MRKLLIVVSAVTCLLTGCLGAVEDFHFDSSISRPVLENYLSRSISFTELLHDDLNQPRNSRGVEPHDNLRLILSTKAKFIGRALMVWGRERNLPRFLQTAKPYAEALHKADSEIVLQAADFEIVTRDVETIQIPEHVLREFGQPVTNRNFRYEAMLYPDGRFVNHWGGRGSVPDMGQLETRMWFYFLTTSYIDVGIEAIHFGQVGLMDKNDPGHTGWLDMLQRVRAYARQHARRHFLICDAHTPTGGYLIFIRFPCVLWKRRISLTKASFGLVTQIPFSREAKAESLQAVGHANICLTWWSSIISAAAIQASRANRHSSGVGTRLPGLRYCRKQNEMIGYAMPGSG
jgi:hypothetical protein